MRNRLSSILDHVLSPKQSSSAPTHSSSPITTSIALANLHHVNTPTLAHLLALIVRTPPSFPPPSTTLLVIDSLSTLFETAYTGQPSKTDLANADQKAKDARRWAAGRRFAVLGSLITALNKLAAMKNMTILVTSQMMTRVSPNGAGTRAVLVPALGGKEWEIGIATRIVLFRDWAPDGRNKGSQGKETGGRTGRKLHQVRFAGVVKTNGIVLGEHNGQGNVVPFTIDEVSNVLMSNSCARRTNIFIRQTGIVPYSDTDAPLRPLSSPIKLSSSASRKRNFEEIADSDAETDDEYGWIEEDEVAAEGLIDEAALTAAITHEAEGE